MVLLLPEFLPGSRFVSSTPLLRVADDAVVSFGLPHGRMAAEVAASPEGAVAENSSFVLAAKRTYRKDPLNGFNRYIGGWNITNIDYWAVRSLSLSLSLNFQFPHRSATWF